MKRHELIQQVEWRDLEIREIYKSCGFGEEYVELTRDEKLRIQKLKDELKTLIGVVPGDPASITSVLKMQNALLSCKD